MKLDASLFAMISSILEVVFILLFVLAIIGLAIAARRGYKRGVFKSTYKLLGLALFLVIAIFTINPFVNALMKLDISGLIAGPIHKEIELQGSNIIIDADVTTVEATLDGLIRSALSSINATAYVGDVTSVIKTLVFSIVSFIVYILDLILIFGIGGAILDFFWIILFKRIAPKVARKLGKLKFVGMAETMVSYVVLLFLFMSPLTSIVNSINQGVQKSNIKNSENETVQDVIRLVDIYNDSLFAKTFFNWNVNLNESQVTFDTYLIDFFAKTANGGEDGITFSKDIGEFITVLGNVAAGIGKNNESGYPVIELTDDVVGSVFDVFTQSEFLTSLVELSFKLALDSDLLAKVIPNSQYYEKIDLEGITFEGEVGTLKNMVLDVVDSGLIDDFFDFNTYELKLSMDQPYSIVEYLDDLFTTEANREKVAKVFNVFNRIDEFKLLSNAIQALGYWGVANDSSYTLLKFLGGDIECDNPYDVEENKTIVKNFLKDIHIGQEIYKLLDATWGIASCGEHVIKNAYYAFAPIPNFDEDSGSGEEPGTKASPKRVANLTEEEYLERQTKAKEDLLDTLSDNNTLDKFTDCITGVLHMNEDGTPKERDASKGEHYALLDCTFIQKIIDTTPFMKKIFDQFNLGEKFGESTEKAKANWDNLMNEVYSDDANAPKPIKFFKNELTSVLNVITNVAKLKNPNSSSSKSSSAPLKLRNNEGIDPDPSSDPSSDGPFEYKDYDTFLEAIINMFDGWINPNDMPGSLLSLDSRIAPYLSELIKCLKPLDSSKIIKAIGIPFITAKLSENKEATQDFFDIDICIEEIEKCDGFFGAISDFLSASTVNNLQHFISGLLMDETGTFNPGIIGDDPASFLEKLNEKIVIRSDDPETSVDETILDEHPTKYYLAEILKSFYNFQLFNPTTGDNANKNMQNLFNFLFVQLEAFNIEIPAEETYEKLNAPGKWEDELTAMTELLAVIGKNKLLNIQDYASDINSALLYSLANETEKASVYPEYDPNMPKNLGEVLGCVGDSVIFSTIMGGLLDGYLDGTLCDVEMGVKFDNIQSGEYWHQEGENMNKLLGNIAQLDLDLQNLDFTKVTNVVGMNEMLHNLADSLIFKDGDTNRFGEWLFAKVGTAMDSMSGGLLEDPDETVWNPDWDEIVNVVDNSAHPNQKIAYYDFLVRDGALPSNYVDNKNGWSNDEFETNIAAFKVSQNYDSLTSEEKGELYKSQTFMDQYYEDVLQYDEIGRLVNVLANGIKLMDGESGIDFTALNSENLNNILTSINNTNCLRICSYNAMSLAKDSIGSNDFVDINQAKFEFLIDAEAELSNYTLGRTNRQTEIDHIVGFYDYYKQLQDITGENIDSSVFFNKAKMQDILGVDANGNNDPEKTDILTNMICELEQTYCFNLYTVNHRTGSDLSFFESLMVSLMEESGLKELADIPDTDTTTIEERVRRISACEVDGTVNTLGYNSSWVVRDGNGDVVGGECSSITGVLKSVIGVTDGDSIDANTLSVTAIEASGVTNVMKAVNDSYLCTGVMKHFIKSAFTGGLGLESMLKFNSTDEEMVADFSLSYLDFGGENNECLEGSEIYAFQKVLESMQYENTSGELTFISLDNLQEALQSKPNCFDGIFYFLYNSKTLEKEYDGNANITGRDILLYNALENFDSYLIGSDKENKMLSIAKIFEITNSLSDDYYKVESNGISRIIDAAGNSIENVTIDNLRNDSTKKQMILNVVKYTYDRNDGNTTFTVDTDVTLGRAYFASEIVSGIFDDVLENEYTTIAENYSGSELANIDDYQKFYFASKATGGRAIVDSDITETIFDNLNDTELNGLDGMISMTEFINGDADRTGANVADIATNPFVVAMTSNSSIIRDLFENKLCTDGVDSRMAKVLFVSRGAKTVEKETRTADDATITNSGLLVLMKYVTNLPSSPLSVPSNYIWTNGFTNDYYDPAFNFDSYGNALMDYVDSCVPTI